PNELSGWQIKLNERRQKLEKRRVRFKLCSLDKDLEIFYLNPHQCKVSEPQVYRFC
ncbi:unnamed protein product, partial [Brassica oleracea]